MAICGEHIEAWGGGGGYLCQETQAGSQARAVQQEEGRFPTLPLLIGAGRLSFPGKGAV